MQTKNLIEITNENFQSVLNDNEIIILDFWASWCGPCRMFAPVFDKVASQNSDIIFGKINTEKELELSEAFQIRSIPTLAIFRDKIMLFSQAGALDENSLKDVIKQVRALDMNQVRKQIEEEQRG